VKHSRTETCEPFGSSAKSEIYVRFSGPFSEPTYFFATGRATTTCLRVFKAGEKASEGKSAFAMYSFYLPAMIAGAQFLGRLSK
jgi:hypothetical protein